jgi:hypothetical protein
MEIAEPTIPGGAQAVDEGDACRASRERSVQGAVHWASVQLQPADTLKRLSPASTSINMSSCVGQVFAILRVPSTS